MRDISYSFIPNKSIAGSAEYPMENNKIYLNVGGCICKGALDHHQEGDGIFNYDCTAQIICEKPHLVFASFNSNPAAVDSVQLVLHDDPIFDCCASAYLASELIIKGKLPDGVDKLAQYAAEINSGRKKLIPGQYFTPFAAVLFLNYNIWESMEGAKRDEINHAILDHTLQLMETLTANLAKGIDPDSQDSLDWGTSPFLELKDDIDRDHKKYLDDINQTNVEIVKIPLFQKTMTQIDEVDAIFIDDPKSRMFKYWARSDTENSPAKKGFALIVHTNTDSNSIIVSTDPNTPYFLPFLGQVIELEETTARWKTGSDTRIMLNPGMQDEYLNFNPDPWYDGRSYDYTIVRGPGSGTILGSRDIRKIVKELYEKFRRPF